MNNEYTDEEIEIIDLEELYSVNKPKPIRRKKIMKTAIIVMCVLVALAAFISAEINAYVIYKYKKNILTVEESTEIKDVDCVMVLGAKVNSDGSPCLMLRDRLDKGIEVYKANVTNRILMTGDHGKTDYDEVNNMKEYAIDKEVIKDEVFMDHAGFSTYESMYRAKEVFGVKKMIIVTQEYHMHRSLYIANKLGIEAYGVCAEDISYPNQFKREVREVAARIKDVWTTVFRPEPTYLGEAIPISGNGEMTDDQ